MNQIEREYKDALDGLRFSGEAKARMVKRLTEQKEEKPVRRRTRPLRMGLIAAAACVLLALTAGAAIYQAQVPRLSPLIDGSGKLAGYGVTGKLAAYPMSRFSGAFLEAAETVPGRADREFATFDEVQAYLGDGIPCVWAEGWESGYTVMIYHDEQQNVWGSDVVSKSPDGRAEIWLRILTEHYPYPNTGEVGSAYGGGPDAVMERLESYQMPNGCVAETFTIDRTAVEGWTYSTCISFFIKDGNFYEVSVDGELANPACLWPEVQEILDSFE